MLFLIEDVDNLDVHWRGHFSFFNHASANLDANLRGYVDFLTS